MLLAASGRGTRVSHGARSGVGPARGPSPQQLLMRQAHALHFQLRWCWRMPARTCTRKLITEAACDPAEPRRVCSRAVVPVVLGSRQPHTAR
jgi:hypothetical protein